MLHLLIDSLLTMLETEDIDDDYFTPASSTSLANIFGKSKREDGTENETLKYTPPKPTKQEEQKATQCIFACILVGYEWQNGAYSAKGKLGFAILKVIKTGIHNAVLYDSNKTTLSCATISSIFEVTLKENVYFSYHDNHQKYWSLYAAEQEMKKILDLLKSLNVILKTISEEDKELAQLNSIDDTVNETDKKACKEEKESDTDSSINRRTKISILNRMANMGHSVLPPKAVSTEKTSDSSDTNESSHYKTVRHKPVKNSIKKNNSDKNLVEYQSLVESGHQNMEHSTNSVPLFSYVNGQLMPVTNSNIISCGNSSSANDMSFFISEQRVSNSEIRINMTRLTDKVDQIIGKLSVIEDKDKNVTSNNFQIEIMQKLLAEYENKIKFYEDFFKGKELNKSSSIPFAFPKENESILDKDLSKKVTQLEQLNKEKDEKISHLEVECQLLNDKINTSVREEIEQLTKEIERLKKELDIKNEELMESDKKTTGLSQSNFDSAMSDKIKNIMNDTFRSISANIESNEEYSGEKVKAITASIIKKVTIEALNQL